MLAVVIWFGLLIPLRGIAHECTPRRRRLACIRWVRSSAFHWQLPGVPLRRPLPCQRMVPCLDSVPVGDSSATGPFG